MFYLCNRSEGRVFLKAWIYKNFNITLTCKYLTIGVKVLYLCNRFFWRIGWIEIIDMVASKRDER